MDYVTNAFKKMRERKWDCIYFAVDAHGTILRPTHKKDKEFDYYPYAIEILQYLSTRSDIKLILYTSSHNTYIESLIEDMLGKHIYFDYINENPEVESNEISDFTSKFHFDVMLDDKAGFNPLDHWRMLGHAVTQEPNDNS